MERFCSLSLKAIKSDERGTSVIELALAAPVLLLFATCVIDLAGCLTSKFALQQAVDRTMQLVSVQPPRTDYSDVRAIAAGFAEVPVGEVTQASWLECDGVREASFNGFCDSGQEVGRFLSITIRSSRTLSLPYGRLVPEGGAIPIVATATLRLQ
jgi:hypothetical protein